MDVWGGGGLVSSTADLVRFFRALLDGRVLSASSLEVMLEPTAAAGNEMRMAMGIFPLPFSSGRWMGHTGFWNVCAGADRNSAAAVAVAVLQRPEHSVAAPDLAAELVAAMK